MVAVEKLKEINLRTGKEVTLVKSAVISKEGHIEYVINSRYKDEGRCVTVVK